MQNGGKGAYAACSTVIDIIRVVVLSNSVCFPPIVGDDSLFFPVS